MYGNHADVTFRIINEYLYLFAGVAYYVSATINPILYNLISAKYRSAFKETLCGSPNLRRDPSTRDTTTTRGYRPSIRSQDGYLSRISFRNTRRPQERPVAFEMETIRVLCRSHDETIEEIYRAQAKDFLQRPFHCHQHFYRRDPSETIMEDITPEGASAPVDLTSCSKSQRNNPQSHTCYHSS